MAKKNSSNTGFLKKLIPLSSRKKIMMLVIPVCVLLSIGLYLTTFLIMQIVTADNIRTNNEFNVTVKREADTLLARQAQDYMNMIAQEQAQTCKYILRTSTGSPEETLDAIIDVLNIHAEEEDEADKDLAQDMKRFSFIINHNGEFVAYPDENAWYIDDAIGLKFLEIYRNRARGTAVREFENFDTPTDKTRVEVCMSFAEISDEYILVSCVTKEKVESRAGVFRSRMDVLTRNRNSSINQTQIVVLITALVIVAAAAVGLTIALVKTMLKYVAVPAHDFIFDIKKTFEEIDGLDLEITKDTEDEIAIARDALLKLSNELKESMDDVLKLSGLTEKFENSANFDMLTGIYNRRRFMELVPKHLVLAGKKNEPTFVIMLDLDKFKLVNDTYGHAAGDAVLKTIATRVKDTVRPYDLFGRYGGEEFIMFISVADATNAVGFADRIRGIIEAAPVVFEDLTIPITTSMGVAQASPDVSFEDAQKYADEALYMAKENGRNRVELYIEGESKSVLNEKQKAAKEEKKK
ncbi:MAG: GGDEF domain-containing protein [Oscillospiraceae bacterium]|nr:GGDEF domain-containing protein [Oscillospiraceae bacterium]